LVAYVFKTLADPYAGRLNLFRVFSGVLKGDTQVTNVTRRAKERIGQLLTSQGKEHEQVDELGAGDIGAVAKLKETRAGDVLASKDSKISFPPLDLPAPVMAFAFEPKTKGDDEKSANAIRRLEEEDPTLDVHRDAQTGEQIIAGLTQIHVEVITDRMKERFGAEINLKPPRVPYLESIRKPAKAHGRYKKQTGGRGQFGDCHIELEPGEPGTGFDFVDAIKGGVIPKGFIPAVEKGIAEAMEHGTLAGYPVKDVRVRLYDGSHHSVDSSSRSCCSRSASRRTWWGTSSATSTRGGGGRSGWRRRARPPRSRPRCRWPRCSTTRATCARSREAGATTRWSSPGTKRSRRTSPRR
jgi:elongation factor G